MLDYKSTILIALLAVHVNTWKNEFNVTAGVIWDKLSGQTAINKCLLAATKVLPSVGMIGPLILRARLILALTLLNRILLDLVHSCIEKDVSNSGCLVNSRPTWFQLLDDIVHCP